MTITTYSIKGPLFKLALEHGKDPEKFVSAKKQYGPIQVPRDIGEKITMAQIRELVKSGAYQWCAYSDQWHQRSVVGWIVGADETGMDFARVSAPAPNELGKMQKKAIADAALARGGKKAAPKALVKSLVEAIRAGDEESAQRLAPLGARGTFEEKCYPGSTDFATKRPLVEAAISSNPRMLGIVIPHADIGGEDGTTALNHAVEASQIANVRALLDAGAKAGHASSLGSTPLMAAAQLETRDILDLLLPVSEVNAQEKYYGNSALMWSIMRRRLENVKALLPVSDLAARNKDGLTALMIAMATDDIDTHAAWKNMLIYDCARLVAKSCGEIDAVDGEGRTALMRLIVGKGKWALSVKATLNKYRQNASRG